MSTIIKDPAHPDFPHGLTGRSRGCRCETCKHAHAANTAHWRLLRGTDQSAHADTTPVREHLARLLAIPGATIAAIARACTVHEDTLAKIHRGQRRCTRAVADTILAITEDQARAQIITRQRYPYAEAVRMARSLQAHGWSLSHIAARLGYAPGTNRPTFFNHPGQEVTEGVFLALRALVVELEAKPGPSDRSRQQARALGFYPPACYEEDGTRVPRSARPPCYKGTDDAEAMTRWEILRLLLRGVTYSEVSGIIGCSDKAPDRVMRRWGLRAQYDGAVTTFRPGQGPVLAVLRDAVAELDLCLVDHLPFEAEVAARVAAVRRERRARRLAIKAARAPLAAPLVVPLPRGRVIRMRRASDASPVAA